MIGLWPAGENFCSPLQGGKRRNLRRQLLMFAWGRQTTLPFATINALRGLSLDERNVERSLHDRGQLHFKPRSVDHTVGQCALKPNTIDVSLRRISSQRLELLEEKRPQIGDVLHH